MRRPGNRLNARLSAIILGLCSLAAAQAQTVWRCQDAYSAHAACPEATAIATQDARSQNASRAAQPEKTKKTQREPRPQEKARQRDTAASVPAPRAAPSRAAQPEATLQKKRQRTPEPHFTARVRRTPKSVTQPASETANSVPRQP